MLKIRRRRDFLHEPLGAQHGSEFGPQHLDCNLALVFEVFREIDGGHSTRAEFALDRVAVGEGTPW